MRGGLVVTTGPTVTHLTLLAWGWVHPEGGVRHSVGAFVTPHTMDAWAWAHPNPDQTIVDLVDLMYATQKRPPIRLEHLRDLPRALSPWESVPHFRTPWSGSVDWRPVEGIAADATNRSLVLIQRTLALYLRPLSASTATSGRRRAGRFQF